MPDIVPPILSSGDLMTVTGAQFVGKTTFLLQMAAAVIRGRRMFHWPTPQQPSRVLYCTPVATRLESWERLHRMSVAGPQPNLRLLCGARGDQTAVEAVLANPIAAVDFGDKSLPLILMIDGAWTAKQVDQAIRAMAEISESALCAVVAAAVGDAATYPATTRVCMEFDNMAAVDGPPVPSADARRVVTVRMSRACATPLPPIRCIMDSSGLMPSSAFDHESIAEVVLGRPGISRLQLCALATGARAKRVKLIDKAVADGLIYAKGAGVRGDPITYYHKTYIEDNDAGSPTEASEN